MKIFLLRTANLSLITIFLACCGPQQKNTEQAKADTMQVSNPENASIPAGENAIDFSKFYQGEIAGRYPIRMQLTRAGNELTGTYAYIKVGKNIPLSGSVDNEGTFSMQETDAQGKVTGVFEGRFYTATGLSGNWRNPATGKELPFSLQEANHDTISESIALGQGMRLIENSFTLEGKNGITGEYVFPYLEGQGTAVKKINEALSPQYLIDESVEDIKATFKECNCGTVGVNYHVNYNANDILDISVIVETLGAYSSGYVSRLTFNTKTGEDLSISKLLKPASLPKLVAQCDQLLQERMKKAMEEAEDGEAANWLKELTQDKKFKAEHLEYFTVSPEGITFYYPFGFPHAALTLEPDDAFLFTFAQLKDDIDPTSVLGPLVERK